LPSQVVPSQAALNAPSSTNAPANPTNAPPLSPTPTSTRSATPSSQLPASRLPMATIAGLAAIGGALAVVFGSSLFRRAAPVPNTVSSPTITVPTPRNGTNNVIIQQPVNETNSVIATPEPRKKPTKIVPSATPDIIVQDARDETTETTNDVPARDAFNSDTDATSDANPDATNEYSNDSNNPYDNASSAASRFIERRRSYSIQPPREFRLTQKGRRTIWKGASGAQLLVEVGDNDGKTPRAGWETLERSLQKKYGAKYRGRGIRDTTLNGREAAVWEFDLEQRDGTVVRKMDVAIAEGKNGYAILASAPVERFEQMRPTLERAVNSFQIEENDATPTPNGY